MIAPPPTPKIRKLTKAQVEGFLAEFIANPHKFDRKTVKSLIERAEEYDLFAEQVYTNAVNLYETPKSRGKTPMRSEGAAGGGAAGGGGGGGAARAARAAGTPGRAGGGTPLSEENDTLLRHLRNAVTVAEENTIDVVEELLEEARKRELTGRSRYKQAEAAYEKLKTKFAKKSKRRRTRKL